MYVDGEKTNEEVAEESQVASNTNEDLTGLKSALKAERDARKQAEKNLSAIMADKNKAEEEDLEKKAQYKELLEKEREKTQSLLQKLESTAIDGFLTGIVNKLTKEEKRGNILKEQIRKHVKYDNGDVVITGLAEVENSDQLAEHFKTEFSFLIDESLASGGGAVGNRSGGAAQNIKTQEQVDLMNPAEKMKFFKAGGQVKT